MKLFSRQADPISEREKELARELRALEDQIAELDSEVRETESRPRVRSTVRPREIPSQNPFASRQEVVFEPVDNEPITEPEPLDVECEHYNELGVRKINLLRVWRRWQQTFRKNPASQSKFVNYLAAGSIQGIRPLRYERRIARNRFVVMFIGLLVILFGIFALLQNSF